MFYKTQIKSVTDGAAFDVTGRRLSFVGYLPVKAGDTVFTDGRVIFGNAPPKGSPAVFDDVPSAIPVLAVGTDNNELRGYFDLRGKFKKYKIKGVDWIVNAKKIYKHDTDTNIIDAEIVHNEQGNEIGVYTVEKVINEIAELDEDYYYCYLRHYFTVLDKGYEVNSMISHSNCLRTPSVYIPAAKADFVERDGVVLKDCNLIVSRDGDEFATINFADVVNELEAAAKKSIYIGDIPDHYFEEHTKSRAILHNFKIFPAGSWVALLEVELWAEFTYFRFYKTTVSRTGSLSVSKRLLLKIYSDGAIEIIGDRSIFYPFWTSTLGEYIENDDPLPIPTDLPTDTFPYYKISGIANFPIGYISPDPPHSGQWIELILPDGTREAGYWTWERVAIYDSRLMPNAPDYDKVIVDVADEFTFPVQDGYYAKFTNVSGYVNSWRFGGIYLGDKQLFGDVTEYYISYKGNLSFAAIKADKFLFGIHEDKDRDIDGALYKINQDGNVELLADRLKNFRLRELKKISNAKK